MKRDNQVSLVNRHLPAIPVAKSVAVRDELSAMDGVNPASLYISGLNSSRSRNTMRTILNTIARLSGCADYYSMPWGKLTKANINTILVVLKSSEQDLSSGRELDLAYYERAVDIANSKVKKPAGMRWCDVNPAARNVWKPKKPNTRRLYLSAIRGVCKEAHNLNQMGTRDYLLIMNIKGPKGGPGTKLPKITGDIARDTVIHCAEEGGVRGALDAAVIATLYGCGLRRDEVRNLSLDSIKQLPDGWSLSFTGKGDTQRQVPIPGLTLKMLMQWIEKYRGWEPGALFVPARRQGVNDVLDFSLDDKGEIKRCSDNMIYRAVKRRFAEFNITDGVAPHDFRRAFATVMFDADVAGGTIQTLLGHSDFNTTKIYDTRSLKRGRSAVKNLGMD